ncbi:hypothetical protein NON20_17135 [Synechocystis sp. B12]|nr:hypothetical protein NON20_17135 [Synechocystis sp. B12]
MNQESDFQGVDRDISVHGIEKVLLEVLERYENEEPNINKEKVYSYFYKPSEELINTLKSFKESLRILNPSKRERQNRGYLLETLALQSFRCLSHTSIFKTYQSAGGPQYDLIISSNDSQWRDKILQSLFYVKDPLHNDHIVVECKAQSSKVNDQVFSRLCCIMDHNIRNASIGIFSH